MLRLYRLYL